MKLTWRQWMDKVNAVIVQRTGLGADDLDDFCYRDWYDNGETATNAARAAIRYAKGIE